MSIDEYWSIDIEKEQNSHGEFSQKFIPTFAEIDGTVCWKKIN